MNDFLFVVFSNEKQPKHVGKMKFEKNSIQKW